MQRKISRRKFLKAGGSAAIGLALPTIQRGAEFDLVIRNGTILDGTGGVTWTADLGLVGDTITAIGSISPERGKQVLEAADLHVAPGFIDIHTHSDDSIIRYPTADSRVRQGVTTEVTGNCGSSMAPLTGLRVEERRQSIFEEYGIEASWSGVASYYDFLEKIKISNNHALLVGQETIRRSTIGMRDRSLTPDELRTVTRAVEEGMDDGAWGLSTGLEYAPGRFTPTEEVLDMARVVSRRGGLYATHVRNEETALLEAINEAIHVGAETGVRVEIAHLKAAGRSSWPKQTAAIHLIESARRAGVQVLADAYPYTAYSTTLTMYMPAWALDGGWEELGERLSDSETRSRIRVEVIEQIRKDPGSYDLIVISSVRTEENRSLVGLRLTQIAENWGIEPVDAHLRLLLEEEGSVSIIGHGMSPANVETVLSHPLVMIGSDGSSMAPEGPAAETKPHPRSYGTFPRVLGHYSRERKLFDLPTAVKKMTSMPADQMGFRDRGRIARGMKADLVVFDAARVSDVASFEDPHRYPRGILHVLVNGELVVENERHTGKRPGRALRKV